MRGRKSSYKTEMENVLYLEMNNQFKSARWGGGGGRGVAANRTGCYQSLYFKSAESGRVKMKELGVIRNLEKLFSLNSNKI